MPSVAIQQLLLLKEAKLIGLAILKHPCIESGLIECKNLNVPRCSSVAFSTF